MPSVLDTLGVQIRLHAAGIEERGRLVLRFVDEQHAEANGNHWRWWIWLRPWPRLTNGKRNRQSLAGELLRVEVHEQHLARDGQRPLRGSRYFERVIFLSRGHVSRIYPAVVSCAGRRVNGEWQRVDEQQVLLNDNDFVGLDNLRVALDDEILAADDAGPRDKADQRIQVLHGAPTSFGCLCGLPTPVSRIGPHTSNNGHIDFS